MAEHNKETIKEVSAEKLLDLLVYLVELRNSESMKGTLKYAELEGDVRKEIIKRINGKKEQ